MTPVFKPKFTRPCTATGTTLGRSTLCIAAAGLFCWFAPHAGAVSPNPALLDAVHAVRASTGIYQIELEIHGQVGRVETASFRNGLFVFDIAQVAWNGPTRRVRPDLPGILEYRFSQFSDDPLITRFVVEVEAGWSCHHDIVAPGLRVICGRSSSLETRVSASDPTLAVVRNLELASPLAGFSAEKLVARSLGFTPQDMIRDGLPNFGSARDDWLGKPRSHKGIDIYVDKTSVQAAGGGKVVGAGRGDRAGGWIKIDHGNGVETVYVHTSRPRVRQGDSVARGQLIATIDGAIGNAVQPQLHFELRLDGQSVDPIPYIFELASASLRRKITLANQRLEVLAQERAIQVQIEFGGSSR